MWKKMLISLLFLLIGMGSLSIGYAYLYRDIDAASGYSVSANATGRINISPSNMAEKNAEFKKGDRLYIMSNTNQNVAFQLIAYDANYTDYTGDSNGANVDVPISAWYCLSDDPIGFGTVIDSLSKIDQPLSTNWRGFSNVYHTSNIQPYLDNLNDEILNTPILQKIIAPQDLKPKRDFYMAKLSQSADRQYFVTTYLAKDILDFYRGAIVYPVSLADAGKSYSSLDPKEGTFGIPGIQNSDFIYSQTYHAVGACTGGNEYTIYFKQNGSLEEDTSILNGQHAFRGSTFIDTSKIVFAISQGGNASYSNVSAPVLDAGEVYSSTGDKMKVRVYNPAMQAKLLSVHNNSNDQVIKKIQKGGTVKLNIQANSYQNSQVSLIVFDDNNEWKYYMPLGPATTGKIQADLSMLEPGKYKLAIVNEIYDENDTLPTESSYISDVVSFEIVKPLSDLTFTAQSGLQVSNNVNNGDTVGVISSQNGIMPITYTIIADPAYPNEYQHLALKSDGKTVMVSGNPLHAGTYHFKIQAIDTNGDPNPPLEANASFTVDKTNLSVAFDNPNQTKKSIAEAQAGWNETATANPTTDTLVTYAKSSGSVALINIDPDTGKITYAGSGGYGKVIIKATADDDPTSGYDDYNPSDTTKEIVIYREVDGTITPHTNSSSTTSPSFQTNDPNIKPNGIIGHITGILGTPDDGASGNTTYTYGLKNVDDYNFFSVNPTTGEIKTTADLSTTTGDYDITVTVSDKWSTKEIAVKINVGLAPAEDLRFYETSAAILMITSKSVVSTDTGVTVFATVKNSGNTNPVTYKIKDGSSDVIEVHPTSGAITIHGVGTKTIVAEKTGGSGQANATAELTFTVTAGEQNFIYTDASQNKLPQTGNRYNDYKETYGPNKTFRLYTDGNPPGSTVTYQLKAGSPNDVITVDPNGLVHILNASMNTQIGKVIVEATSHDPSGNYSDKTIELPITIERGTRTIAFADNPIYVISGSGNVVPNILVDGNLDTDNNTTIEVDSSQNSIAWTNDGVTIRYNWNDAQGKDVKIHVTKPADRNYKASEADGTLHILGADENVLTLSTPGKIIYGDHFAIKSTQDDSMSTNVQYTFETDNQVFISVPQVNGNKAEFDALAYSGSTTINVKVTRTADGELPLTKTVQIKVLPKPITITIDDKEKKRLEENPPLTFQDFTSQLVSWNGVKDTIDTSHIHLSTTAKKYSPIGSYPITSGNAEKQLNDNYPNYTFTIKQGLLNVIDNGNKDFWDIDDDGCPDLNIKITDDEGNEITINGDLNDDGIPDFNIDTNGDGKPDLNIDTDKDGKPDINLVVLKEWKPTKCVTLNDIQFSSGITAKPEINIDLDNDMIPDINIDNKGDFKPHLNISKDGKTPSVNITTIHDWNPGKDYKNGKFQYDSIGDEIKPELNIDSDDDSRPDINLDLDDDGKPDINIDWDGDLIPDTQIDNR